MSLSWSNSSLLKTSLETCGFEGRMIRVLQKCIASFKKTKYNFLFQMPNVSLAGGLTIQLCSQTWSTGHLMSSMTIVALKFKLSTRVKQNHSTQRRFPPWCWQRWRRLLKPTSEKYALNLPLWNLVASFHMTRQFNVFFFFLHFRLSTTL